MAVMNTGIDTLVEPLTAREHEILMRLTERLSNQEIANQLHLSEKTIRWYNSRIFAKLGVANRKQAAEQANELGLLEPVSYADKKNGRHNLPAQATAFVGRQHELCKIGMLLDDRKVRLITILAPGGMGKTRLALEVAGTQVDRYSDGVFFVPLAPVSSPDSILTTIAEIVGFSFYGSDPAIKQLLDYLRERKMLLVMDNFEHILDGAALVTDILQAAPQVRVLATSREKLNLHSETVFLLSGLRFFDQDSLGEVLEYDAIQLFMQSARRTWPEFAVQQNDLDDLALICRLTEGNPLGIELAAGWVEVLTLKQIAAELQQGIDILETDLRDIPERHRSIRSTFERTWRRLTGGERAVFSRLSVFRGGFTLSAAQVVAGANANLFRRLAQKALIQPEADERFGIHELLRQYGQEKLLQAQEADVTQQAHSTYYMDFMAARDADIKGRRQEAGLQEIRADFENVRKAWLWAVEHKQVDPISRALDCLVNFADMSFSELDAHMLLQQIISAFHPSTDEAPHLVWDQAVIRREGINFLLGAEINVTTLETVLARMRKRDAHHEVARSLAVLSHYHGERIGNYAKATTCVEESLALWYSSGDAYYIAGALVSVGHTNRFQHEVDRNLECLRECARIQREIGDYINLCSTLGFLSWNLSFYGAFAEAESLQNETLVIQARLGKVPYYAFILGNMATLAFWRGDFKTANQLVQDGLDFAKGRSRHGLQEFYLALLSWIASVSGDYQRGYDLCPPEKSASLKNLAMYVFWGMAFAQCGLGDYQAAWQSLQGSLRAAREYTRGPTYQQFCLPIGAVLMARTGKIEHAATLIGLTQAAPKELMGWLAEWQLYQAACEQLETELGASTYSALLADGASLDLDMVVDELLAGFMDTEADMATNRRRSD
jgi:predicted ATPase/DNA-binding CsgD family transcriptional regulator